jgi:ketosteroid isomerase-like protein
MKNFTFTAISFLLCSLVFAQDRSADEKELRKLSTDWMVATMKRDQNTLNKIVAPEFKLAGTDLDNPGISRDIWMKNTMENLKIDSINYNKVRIDVIGDVAIVQSNFYWSVAYLNSPAKKDTVNLVDTWIRRKQGWQVVSRLVVD